jgi:uncharacterized protein (TIGR03067 family)
MSYAAGDAAASGLASAQAVALTKGVLQTMMLTKLKLVAAAVLAVAVVAGAGGLAYNGRAVEPSAKDDKKADKPKGDKDLIQGTWKVKKVVMEGKDVSDKGGEAKFFMESTWTITEDKIIIKSGAEVGESKFKLDPAARPKAIDWTIVTAPNMEVMGKTFLGVYALEGDALKILLGADRPTELKTKEGGMTMMLVLTRETRMAPNRMASQTNLKQIALAMHNYENLHGHLPAAAIRDNNGKPLLSWRVAILPYIEQANLYDQFKLHEPWDSAHNKKLLKEMPSVYAPVNVRTKEPYTTFCQVFTGKGTAFESDEGQKIADIVDGTSNTLMVVEASEPVPWTKPEDLVYDPHKPLPKLGRQLSDGFNAAFCDATVRLIQKSTKESVLRALITRNGGEVISPEEKP